MRSFAVIAGFAAAANAYAVASSAAAEYPAYPVESSAAPEYAVSSAAPEYAASSAAPEYPAYPVSSAPAYAASSAAPEYPAYPVESSAAPEYAASSAAPEYPVVYSSAPAYTTTKVVTGLTTVCPEPTTVTYGSKTYTVSTSTTLIDEECEYTTTEVVKPTPAPVMTPVHSEYAPPKYTSAAPPAPMYPSSNGTVPQVPAGTAAPSGSKPSSTKPSSPEFTGAASKATVGGFMAIAGVIAAFL